MAAASTVVVVMVTLVSVCGSSTGSFVFVQLVASSGAHSSDSTAKSSDRCFIVL
jgi:hypothetical protein